MRTTHVLISLILISSSLFSQSKVEFNDGHFYCEGEEISVNEFSVMLEKTGNMTRKNKRLMQKAQYQSIHGKQISKSWAFSGVLFGGIAIYEYFSDDTYVIIENMIINSSVSFLFASINREKAAHRKYSAIVDDYNLNLKN